MNYGGIKKNIISNYVGRSYSILSIYIYTPVYIKILGIESFGVISFFNILLLLTVVADVGLSSTFTREAARSESKGHLLKLLCSIEIPLIVAATVVALIPFFLSGPISEKWFESPALISSQDISNSVKIMSATIPVQMLITLYSSGLMGLQKQVQFNKVQMLYVTIRSGLVVPFIYFVPRVDAFLLWQLVSMIVFALIFRLKLSRSMGSPGLAVAMPSIRLLRSIAGFSSGAFAIAAISNLNNQLDKIFVSAHFSVAEFGNFGAASTITQIANAVVAPIIAAIFPVLVVKVAQRDQAGKSELYESVSIVIAFCASLATFFLFFFADDVLAVWLGADTESHIGDIVRLLSLGWLFFALQLMPTHLSLAEGDTLPVVAAGIGMFLIAAPLLFWLADIYGLVGAAIPWFLGNVVSFFILSTVVLRRYFTGSALGWLVRCTAVPIGISGCIAGLTKAATNYFDLGPLISCLAAGFVGVAALFLFGRWSLPVLTRLSIVDRGPGDASH